jgi:REP element-mobilizing transposase RayT
MIHNSYIECSIRLKGWDYSSPGWYFVTINTHAGRPLFGTVVNGRMVLSHVGRMVQEMWLAVERFHPEYHLDAFVVMPNHVHGLVRLEGAGRRDGLPVPALPDFVRRFKSTADVAWRKMAVGADRCVCPDAMRNCKLWHRNYWDVIVRDEQALANIRRYIRNNPQNYEVVMQCGEPRLLGNAALMKLPKVGFLASRGAEGLCTKGLDASSPFNAIISGFLSPMERAVFKAGLAEKRPLIWVKSWGFGTPSLTEQAAIDAGRLLIVSPFPDSIEAPSVRRAAWCNEYVLAHCDRMVIGHLNPSGMLACILSERKPDQEIIYL